GKATPPSGPLVIFRAPRPGPRSVIYVSACVAPSGHNAGGLEVVVLLRGHLHAEKSVCAALPGRRDHDRTGAHGGRRQVPPSETARGSGPVLDPRLYGGRYARRLHSRLRAARHRL